MRLLAIAVAGLTLAACAAVPSSGPTALGLQAFQNGQAGALVVNFEADLSCAGFTFGISGMNPGETFFSAPRGPDPSEPAVLPLPPGRYSIRQLACHVPGAHPSAMSGIDTWFGEFEIRPGEATYVGVVTATRVQLPIQSDLQGVDRLLRGEWGTPMITYLTFAITGDPTARTRVAEVDPAIAAAMVFQPLEQTLPTDEFMARIRAAHAVDETGAPPTAQVVRQRLGLDLTGNVNVEIGKATSPAHGPDPTAPYRPYIQNNPTPPIVIYM